MRLRRENGSSTSQAHLPCHRLAKRRDRLLMFQKHCTSPGAKPFCCHDGWKVSLVGSRITHAAESRYTRIEGEALAVADALGKARFFVLGPYRGS